MKQINKYSFFIALLLFGVTNISSQIEITAAGVSGVTNAGEGDYYLTTDSDEYYVGTSNGTLRPVGNVTVKGSSSGNILVWNATTLQWESKVPDIGALTLTKSTIRNVDRARLSINASTNVNTGFFTMTPGAFELNQTGATVSGTSISGLTGNIRFIIQPYLRSSSARTNFICNFLINGSLHRKIAGSFYARFDTNHNDTGASYVFEYEGATATDQFSFALEREANTSGNVALINSGSSMSYIFINQYTDVEVITNVEAPIDLSIAQGPTGPVGVQGPIGPQGPAIGSPTDVYHAAGNVSSLGVANYIQGATVSRTGPGRYTVLFTIPHANGVSYPVIFSMEQNPGDDDYVPTYTNVNANGFDVEIGEQDNGGVAGVPVDAGFSFYVPL